MAGNLEATEYVSVSKEYAALEPVVLQARAYQTLVEDIEAAELMLEDPEMKGYAEEELVKNQRSSKSAPGRAVMKLHFSPVTCFECTSDTPMQTAGRSKFWKKTPANTVDIARLLRILKAKASSRV